MPLPPASRFAILFAAQFAAVGVMMPFYPAILAAHGLGAPEVAAVLATGSALKLLAAPTVGRRADSLADPRLVVLAAALLAAATACGFALVGGFAALLLVAALHHVALAPVVPLSDALALSAARREGFDYGRVRSAGSITFILGAVLAGQAVVGFGLTSVVWLYAGCLVLAGAAAWGLPAAPPAPKGRSGFRAPFADPAFPWLLPVSALIQGSHALYYGFATIHWTQAGLSPGLIGLLWGEAVVAEVALFLWGRPLVERLGAPGLALLAAGCGMLRWGVTAETTWLPALALVQLLHAATFGAMHLGAMRVLAGLPPAQAATAQTLHSSLGVGLTMGVLTFGCGPLFQALGGRGFWAMAALCALAVPVALGLRRGLGRRE